MDSSAFADHALSMLRNVLYMTIYDILHFESFLDEPVDLSEVFPLHLLVQDLLQILSVHPVGAFNSTALSQLHLQNRVDSALLLTY